MSKATTRIIIDHMHPKKDNTCAVYLRVTYDRKIRHFSISRITYTPEEFEKIMDKRSKGTFRSIALKFNQEEARALEIINKMRHFNFDEFEKQFTGKKDRKNKVLEAFKHEAEKLRQKGRIGTAVSYECAMNSLEAFKPGLTFGQVNEDFLEDYQESMLNTGKSITTVGIYLRSLRALMNVYEVPKDLYPFKDFKIPTSNNIKKAFSKEEIKKIFDYTPETDEEAYYRDFWLFLYLYGGINVTDAVKLKWSDIEGRSLKYGIKGDYLTFYRQKSIRTKKNNTPVVITLNDDQKKILSRIENKESEFLIKSIDGGSILDGTENPVTARAKVQQLTKMINKYMKQIGVKLDLGKITTYTARHSFASVLYHSGVPINTISGMMAHANTKTTQSYLSSLDKKQIKDALSLLTQFD